MKLNFWKYAYIPLKTWNLYYCCFNINVECDKFQNMPLNEKQHLSSTLFISTEANDTTLFPLFLLRMRE